MKYDPSSIESKWQTYWIEQKLFFAHEGSKPKYYILDMFPYPSGAGLHVGHLVGYTATDIIARYKWQCGYEVLHPMGWDSFGLPAEQYAIKTGTHPAHITAVNIENFKRQLQALGYAYDWSREIATSDPSYYKWTQWIFTKLYEKGLAYQTELLVNYCPTLGTVLANEEVEQGKSKEGGYPVERRPLKQWVLKITAYADRLLEDLEHLQWPEGLKKLQTNWIGRSEGLELSFVVKDLSLKLFTTRADTLFGVTFLAVSPEHPQLHSLVTQDQQQAVDACLKKIASISDLDRTEFSNSIGCFTGSYAIHPVTKHSIPIWIADYVLMSYGTGCVMGVPAHDSRDYAFAKRYNIDIQVVVIAKDPLIAEQQRAHELCWEEEGEIINSHYGDLNINGYCHHEAAKKVIQWSIDHAIGTPKVCYKLRDWLFSRQRYWGEPFPILHLADGSTRVLTLNELPLISPEVKDYKPEDSGLSPLAKVKEWVQIHDVVTDQMAYRETDTMPQWAGSCWYYLRFTDPHNTQQAWGEAEKYWMPVDLYIGGAEHAVLHLLYARFWHKVLYDLGLVSSKEPFKQLCNQGIIVAPSYRKAQGGYVAVADVVMQDGCYVHKDTKEVLIQQIEKMSKSKLNGVSPDEVVAQVGADAVRLYMMFMGPIDKEKIWNSEGLQGCRRFLNRFYEMATSDKLTDDSNLQALGYVHRLIHGVTVDLDKLYFNTAIAKMMEFVNHMYSLQAYPKEVVVLAIKVLAPFAPHMAEELWHYHQQKGSVTQSIWPQADERYLQQACANYAVQVNGKLKAVIECELGLTQEAVLEKAMALPKIVSLLQKPIRRVIFVQDKLLNLVI